jgi:PAS domain S-box-containing protein
MVIKAPRCFAWLVALALLAPLMLASPAPAAQPPKEVSVAVAQDTPPFYFANDDGQAVGWLVDIWKLWSQKTGIKVKFVVATWDDTLKLVKQGKVDIHGGCFYSKARAKYLDYVTPLVTAGATFFFKKNLFAVNNLKDLLGFRIGVIKGDFSVGYLRKHLPGAALAIYPTYQEMHKVIKSGALRALVVDAPTGIYFLKKWNLLEQFSYYPDKPLYKGVFTAAVKKGDALLPPLIKKGMARITSAEKVAIERRWLGTGQADTKEVLRIAAPPYMPPMVMLGPTGRPTGLFIDFWRLWAKKTKKKIEFVFGDWEDTLRYMRKGTTDIHSGLFRTPQREEYLYFSLPIYFSRSSFAFRKSQKPLSQEELAKAKVGVVAGSAEGEVLAKKYPHITQQPYQSFRGMLTALQKGQVDAVFAGGNELQATVRKMGLSTDIRVAPGKGPARPIVAGVPRGDFALLGLVNEGIAAIADEEMQRIEEQWISNPSLRYFISEGRPLELTERETFWLKRHPKIRLGVDPGWMPFEGISPEGVYQGVSSGIIALISKRLGVQMKPESNLTWPQVLKKAQKRELDLLPAVMRTPQREEYLQFTRPYLSFPIVVVTRTDAPVIVGLKSLKGKTVATPKGYAITDLLTKDHGDLKLKLVTGIQQGLEAVDQGQADAYVGNMASINYSLNRLGLTGLKIAATTKYNFELAMAVRKDWPELATIVQKALYSLTAQEKTEIASQWINMRFTKRADWGFILRLGGAAAAVIALILTIIIIWNRRMAKEVAQRQKAEERFQTMAANVPGAIFQILAHADGRREYLFINQQAEEFFGVPPEVVIREGRHIVFHPEDKDRLEQEIKQAFSQEEEVNAVGRIILPDGEMKWVRINAYPGRSDDGDLIYNGFILDITERKLAEQEYLASERKMKAMSQAVDDALVMIDSQGLVLFWNQAAEHLFGYPVEEAVGMDFHAMAVPEQYRGTAKVGLVNFAKSGQGEVFGRNLEMTAMNRLNETFPVEVSISSFQVDEEWFAVGTVRDISERKEAEETLKESENYMKKILDTSRDGFWFIDNDGYTQDVNGALCRILGRPKNQVVGKHVFEFYDEENLEILKNQLAQRDKLEENAYEISLSRPDGVLVPCLFNATPFQDDTGQKIGSFAMVSDITERKQAENQLKLTQNTVDKSAQSIYWVDPETGRFTYVNEAACKSLGYSKEELLGMGVPDIEVGFDPEKLKNVMQALQEKPHVDTEGVHRTKDGRLLNVMLSIVLTEYQDHQIIGVYAKDITDLKRAEEALKQSEERSRLILESAGEGIFGVGPQGQVTFVNPAAVDMLGFSEEELLGNKIHAIIHHHRADNSEYPVEECPMYDSYTKGEINHIDDEVLWRKDGSSFPVEYASMPIAKEGEVVGAVVTFRDITERLKAERERDDAYQVISSSINYATHIQRSILPPAESVAETFPKHFVLWEPRDGVGGDVYFYKPWGLGKMLALGDCTGHGVPGAFMTLITNGALDIAVMETMPGDPATLLQRTHQWIQTELGQEEKGGKSDDGLEMGVVYHVPGRDSLVFAGARFSLFYMENGEVFEVKGDKKGLGYCGIPQNVKFSNHEVEIRASRSYFMTSDGLIDQIGGPKRRGFGKKRFKRLLLKLDDVPMEQKGERIYQALLDYQGDEKRRDDVSILGFTFE